MYITSSHFLYYSYDLALVQCEHYSHNDKIFLAIPNMPGSMDQSGSGSGHATTQALATLQLMICELQYVLQYIVINKTITNNKKNCYSYCIFSSLSTKYNWHHNCHNHGLCQQKWPRSAPHEALRSMLTLRMDGWQPTELADVFWGGLRVFMALKVFLCSNIDASSQHRSVLRAIHTLNSPQKSYPLAQEVVTHPFDTLAQSARLYVVH